MSYSGRIMESLNHRLRQLEPEVDYQALRSVMPEQSNPRRKVVELQRQRILLRLKNGFYVFTPEFLGREYSPEIVANLLYGPSYISLESALSIHGLIPERVEVWTSVTSQKIKTFETAIGTYQYRHLNKDLYPLGVELSETQDGRQYLIASPLKAMLDLLTLNFKSSDCKNRYEVSAIVREDLRVDMSALIKTVEAEDLEPWKKAYKRRPWCHYFLALIEEER